MFTTVKELRNQIKKIYGDASFKETILFYCQHIYSKLEEIQKELSKEFTSRNRKLFSPPAFERGSGLKMNRNKLLKIGRGLDKKSRERYATFGKYLIHTPSLENGHLSIRFPSLAIYYRIKPRQVSQMFQNFLLNALDNSSIDTKMFNLLSSEEKDLFKQMTRLCQVHFESDNNDPLFQDKLKRFEILKGEIIAGNDNRQLLKELKQYIKDFMADGVITKTAGYNLLEEISVI